MKRTPETIYLIPGEGDEYGATYYWCEDPAPGEGMDPADAVEYVRKDKHDSIVKRQDFCDKYDSAQQSGGGMEPFAYYRRKHGHEMLFPSDVGAEFIFGDDWTPLYTYQADKPERDWRPAHGMSDYLPEIGQPVIGYHLDWVDDDFCKDGIRECFLFGDGSEWQSARWDGCFDQWIVEDGAPELWREHPEPPDMGEKP